MSLAGKTLFITGASRGIGLAIALRAARDGANIAIAAKTGQPNPKLEGTVYSAAEQIERAGGKALPIVCDIRFEDQVIAAVAACAKTFGAIDICVNNASAIFLAGTEKTEMKRYDLMHEINARGTFLVSKACIPYLKQRPNPHVLMLSPPLDLNAKWFAPHPAYTMAKFAMSLCVFAMAAEFTGQIGFNALWPRTAIATAAIRNILAGEEGLAHCRTPEIVADAAWYILNRPKSFTGNFLIDDSFLAENGVSDYERYRIDPTKDLLPDFFVPDSSLPPKNAGLKARG